MRSRVAHLILGATLTLASVGARDGFAQTRPARMPDAGFGMGPPVSAEIVEKAASAPIPEVKGPFEANWDSIRANYKVPQWFIDAKFGITMHWGLYSIPAHHNEWYEKHMYGDAAIGKWHAENFGPQDQFGYKDFIPKFTAEKFNADEWAKLVKESGAKYLMPTCEHHDGFSMWDSAVNPWNAAKMGPKQDVIGELAVAARKEGLKFGVCNHNIEHYTFIQPRAGLKTDLNDPKYADFYWVDHNDANLQKFLENWVAKNVEIIDKYRPDIIWFDNGVNSRAYDPLKMKVAAYYYNRAKEWGKDVTIDTKDSAYLAGSILNFEKMIRGPKKILPGIWEAEETAGSTWGYTSDETFRGPGAIIALLCDIVSKNGNLMLNLSPMGDGAINEKQQEMLKEVGKWLGVNGEAIYGTHNWTTFMEGATGSRGLSYRFRVKDENLYAIALAWPGEQAVITSLASGKGPEGKIESVSLLGSDAKLEFTQDADGLKVKMPGEQVGKYAFVLKITGLKMNPAGAAVPATMAEMRE